MNKKIAKMEGEEEMQNASRSLMREGTEMEAPIKMTEWRWGGGWGWGA
jgi:hypothetical protein